MALHDDFFHVNPSLLLVRLDGLMCEDNFALVNVNIRCGQENLIRL